MNSLQCGISRRRFITRLAIPLLTTTTFLKIGIHNPAVAGEEAIRALREASWPRNTIRQVQRTLAELGYEPGPIDGLYGPKTASAIREFQRASDKPVTGVISSSLLDDLDI